LIVLLFIRATLCALLVCIDVLCSVSWLFWLSCQYLPSDWLERLLCGSKSSYLGKGIISTKPGLKPLRNDLYCVKWDVKP